MAKSLFIAEKPSVAQEFAKALHVGGPRSGGYMEDEKHVITWCVGHLVTMSYPDAYDPALKRWSLSTLPFIPKEFRYEIIPSAAGQYRVVSSLLLREDIETVYVCTDSGREGEYIYRLVEQMSGMRGKERRRVWIDSQTEEEILRGIREAKDLSEYDNLAAAAYLRAKEDYLMGINFSRLLTLKYGRTVSGYLGTERTVISVGRVMTCVLGMVVRREREIRDFVKTPFYRVIGSFGICGNGFEGDWRAVSGSAFCDPQKLYKENGYKKREDAEKLVEFLKAQPTAAKVFSVERKKENKKPPLLFNLAELQNECSRRFKLSPDETLKIVQELYEKKLVTYPRTDARVLSSAVAKEIDKNIAGLRGYEKLSGFASEVLESGSWKNITKTRYVNDSQITDHYAIIPTGQGYRALQGVSQTAGMVYEVIARRFLAVFYPAAQYNTVKLVIDVKNERFFSSFRALVFPGWQAVLPQGDRQVKKDDDGQSDLSAGAELMEALKSIRSGSPVEVSGFGIKEGETSPPKRYTSGSMILAMENAGQLIEDEELRAQIKGSGIGTSATRAEILNKLVKNEYISLNKKTQVLTPTLLGEMIFDVVRASIYSLLNPELTASWEKGLTLVSNGEITSDEYMVKLSNFIIGKTDKVKSEDYSAALRPCFDAAARYYDRERYKKSGTRRRPKSGTASKKKQ